MAHDIRVGIELDGRRCTILTLSGTDVSQLQTYTCDSEDAALRTALAALRPQDPVRLLRIAPGTVFTRLDITASDLTHVGLAAKARTVTGSAAEGTGVAAIPLDISAVDAGVLGSAVAVVAPQTPADDAYAAVSGRNLEVVPSPFVLNALEGLCLGLHWAAAELTLVSDGHPVAFVQLPVGGLAPLEALLGGTTGTGSDRLIAALSGDARQDPIAAFEVDRYVRTLLGQVKDTLAAWARAGERVSSDLFIFGAGATARQLDDTLAEFSLHRDGQHRVTFALSHLSSAERAQAVGAYAAATSFGSDMPYAAFPDPRKVKAAQADARSRRRTRRVRTLVAAAVLALAGTATPLVTGAVLEKTAAGQLATAQQNLKQLGTFGTDATVAGQLQSVRDRAVTADASGTLQLVVDKVPEGVTVSQVRIYPTPNTLQVVAQGEAADLGRINDYVKAVEDIERAHNVTLEQTSSDNGRVRFRLAAQFTAGTR